MPRGRPKKQQADSEQAPSQSGTPIERFTASLRDHRRLNDVFTHYFDSFDDDNPLDEEEAEALMKLFGKLDAMID